MKTVRLFFVTMIAAVLLPGTSLARQADHPSQQTPSQSGDRSYSNSGEAAQISKRSANPAKTTTKRSSSTIHSQPPVSHPRRLNETPATSGPWVNRPGTITGPQGAIFKAAVPAPNQAVKRRSPPVLSPAVSVNGQQFKNSRDRGAHLAVSGGPLTSSRGTAAINGTNMKRKP
jgi:hypothetical protein